MRTGIVFLAPVFLDCAYRRDGSREVIQRVVGFHTGLNAWLVEVANDRGHVADTRGRLRTMYVRRRIEWFQVGRAGPSADLSRRQLALLSQRRIGAGNAA